MDKKREILERLERNLQDVREMTERVERINALRIAQRQEDLKKWEDFRARLWQPRPFRSCVADCAGHQTQRRR